jgi:hypothetical protein
MCFFLGLMSKQCSSYIIVVFLYPRISRVCPIYRQFLCSGLPENNLRHAKSDESQMLWDMRVRRRHQRNRKMSEQRQEQR